MKSLYKILLLGTCASSILAASSSFDYATGGGGGGAAGGAGRRATYHTNVDGVCMVDGNRIIVYGDYCPDSFDVIALRESLYSLSGGRDAYPSHPQTLLGIAQALLSLKDLNEKDALCASQLIKLFLPMSKLNLEERGILVETILSQALKAPHKVGVTHDYLATLLASLTQDPTTPEEKARAQTHAAAITRVAALLEEVSAATIAAAPRAEEEEDTFAKLKLLKEGHDLFLNAIALHGKAAQLGFETSLDRLYALLTDESTMLVPDKAKSFATYKVGNEYKAIYGQKTLKRVNKAAIHKEIGLAILRRSDGKLTDALSHLEKSYKGTLKATLQDAMEHPELLKAGSDLEQIALQLLHKKYAPLMVMFGDTFTKALTEAKPAEGSLSRIQNLQRFMLAFVNVLRANGENTADNKFLIELMGHTRRALSTAPQYGTHLEWLGDMYHLLEDDALAVHHYGLAYASAKNSSALKKISTLGEDATCIARLLVLLDSVGIHQTAASQFHALQSQARTHQSLFAYKGQQNLLTQFIANLPAEVNKLLSATSNQDQNKIFFSTLFWNDGNATRTLYGEIAPGNRLLTEEDRENITARILASAQAALGVVNAGLAPLEERMRTDKDYAERAKAEVHTLQELSRPDQATYAAAVAASAAAGGGGAAAGGAGTSVEAVAGGGEEAAAGGAGASVAEVGFSDAKLPVLPAWLYYLIEPDTE